VASGDGAPPALHAWEREGSGYGEAERWVLLRDLNEFKNSNFLQTWFAPKVTFPSSKN
jgi:hypothetical protein